MQSEEPTAFSPAPAAWCLARAARAWAKSLMALDERRGDHVTVRLFPVLAQVTAARRLMGPGVRFPLNSRAIGCPGPPGKNGQGSRQRMCVPMTDDSTKRLLAASHEALAEVGRDNLSWDHIAAKLGMKVAKRRRRKPSLADARRRAEKAGMVVIGETWHADGARSFSYGKPNGEDRSSSNPWDVVLKHDQD
jgi:hypothetical protein